MDAALNGGIRQESLAYLLGNPGTGRNVFAARFLLTDQNSKSLWIAINATAPQLPDDLKDTWESAIQEEKLQFSEIDITFQSEAEILNEIQSVIEKDSYHRVVIHNIDLLEMFQDQKLFLRLVKILRQSHVTAILIGTLENIGQEICLSPPSLAKLADYIVLTRLTMQGKDRSCILNVVKSMESNPAQTSHPYQITREGLLILENDWEFQEPQKQTPENPNIPHYEVLLAVDYINAEEKRMIQHRTNEVNQSIQDADYRLHKGIFNSSQYDIYIREFKNGQRKEDFLPIDINCLRDCINLDLIYPLNDYFTDEWRDQYLPTALQQCTFDGQLWAIPHWINVGVLVYRSDLLEKYQFEPPRTWQELREYTDYILKRENNPNLYGYGFQGAAIEALTCNFLEFLWNYGTDIYDPSHHIIINNDKAVEALQYMQDLIHKWKIAPSLTPDMGEDQVSRYFFNEKLIFMRHWLSVVSSSYTDYLSLKNKIKVAPLPTAHPSLSPQGIIGATCYVIPRYVKRPEKLIQFYKEFFTPDAIVEFAIKGGGCPAFKSVYSNPDVLRYRPYYQELPALLRKGRMRENIVYYSQITKQIQNEVNLVLRKIKSPRETLDRIADELSKNIFHKIHSRRLHSALEYINKHLSEELTRPKVASQCNLSPSYFGSLFKEVTGLNFSDYVNLKRVEKAKLLLEDSDQNIAEISLQVGFSDQSYFCQVFKKLAQMTPTQYRMNVLSRSAV